MCGLLAVLVTAIQANPHEAPIGTKALGIRAAMIRLGMTGELTGHNARHVGDLVAAKRVMEFTPAGNL
jgi:hypothetical protein